MRAKLYGLIFTVLRLDRDVCFRSEEVKDVHNEEQKCQVAEASGSAMDCPAPSSESNHQDSLGR